MIEFADFSNYLNKSLLNLTLILLFLVWNFYSWKINYNLKKNHPDKKMAITLKIETLNSFNELIFNATKGEDSFPDNLCNFLVNEFEYQAMVQMDLK